MRARLRLIFPLPVTVKRFLALEWVFILGMSKYIVEKRIAKVELLANLQKETLKLFGKISFDAFIEQKQIEWA